MFGFFHISQLVIYPIIYLLLTHRYVLVLPINNVTSIENYFVRFQKLCCVLLLYEANNSWLLWLNHLNLFYCAFVLEKCHQLLLSVERFWDVFYVHSVFLISIVAILIELALLKLRSLIILRVLWCFLNNWRWWYPKATTFIRCPWRRWKERKWISKSLALALWLFIIFSVFPLCLIIP